MHTHGSITGDRDGMICKCMDCARERQQALRREALLRCPQRYRRAEDDLLAAQVALEAATAALQEARTRESRILEEIRDRVFDEADAA